MTYRAKPALRGLATSAATSGVLFGYLSLVTWYMINVLRPCGGGLGSCDPTVVVAIALYLVGIIISVGLQSFLVSRAELARPLEISIFATVVATLAAYLELELAADFGVLVLVWIAIFVACNTLMARDAAASRSLSSGTR